MSNPTTIDVYKRPTWVYRLYDSSECLLYVGATWDLETRWASHRREKAWWPEVAEKRTVLYPNRFIALRVEAEAIASESPIHNIGGTEGYGEHLRALRTADKPEHRSRHKNPAMLIRVEPDLIQGAKEVLALSAWADWTMNDFAESALAALIVDTDNFLEELSVVRRPRKMGRPPKT